MYFSRAKLNRHALRSNQFADVINEGYGAHKLAWRLFSDHERRERDFVYRWKREGGEPVLYVVSDREPAETAAFDIQTKAYDPDVSAGEWFEFSVVVNAVVKQRDANGRQTRHDVVLKAKREDTSLSDDQAALVAGKAWLDAQGSRHGFRVESTGFRVNEHTTRRFKKTRGSNEISLSTLDLEGLLECTDVSAFRDALFHGIGPAKGYGCGLLMIRRVAM
ncbi:MAG: type I-E CRISPR-associated protein Cas6/Cse3/CasE [bacterium]